MHKQEGTRKEREGREKKSKGVGGGDDGGGEGLREGGVGGCSFKGNVQPGVKLQPIVLHIVPEANSKNSNKKRNHPLT